jgi:hypothetical protein
MCAHCSSIYWPPSQTNVSGVMVTVTSGKCRCTGSRPMFTFNGNNEEEEGEENEIMVELNDPESSAAAASERTEKRRRRRAN